jgi:hypothetical protein
MVSGIRNRFFSDFRGKNAMHKKDLKFELVAGRVSEAKFYLYQSK